MVGVSSRDVLVDGHPQWAYAAAVSGLAGMTLSRLSALMASRSPHDAWLVARGDIRADGPIGAVLSDPASAELARSWRSACQASAVAAVADRCASLAITVVVAGDALMPAELANDLQPPPVLFVRGQLGALCARKVAIVGTRNATAHGRAIAERFASQLAEHGISVVSGLAKGIDGAAHRGALGVAAATALGRPVAVVGSGLDVVYPRAHAALWAEMVEHGVVLSEYPPGAPPLAHHFPQRNRIVAGMSEAVVVVESRLRGGSLITVDRALERDVAVLAVPGSLANPASGGTNQLIRDGATPVLDVGDILTQLDITHRQLPVQHHERRQRPSAADLRVLAVLVGEARSLDGVVLAAGGTVVEVAMSLARLQAAGWVDETDGWYQHVGSLPA